jgi:hypothetical protein
MAATRKEQQMNPLTTDKFWKATFLAVAALVLAAPAGAGPILSDNELGDAPAAVATKPDLEHQVLGQGGSAAVAPDAVDRAVAIRASQADNGAVVLRKSGTVVVTGKQQPAWYTALMARSQAMNEFYGAGDAATAIHPNDRAVPRPVSQQPLVSAPSSGNDGTEWGNIAIGALGGLGIALLLVGGTLVVLHKRRHDDRVALP